MRYRRILRNRMTSRGKNLYAATSAIVVVFVLVAYAIGLSGIGTWAAARLVAPVFRLGFSRNAQTVLDGSKPSETANSTPVIAAAGQTIIKLPAVSCYALQMGVYKSRENAQAQADALRSLGAGGYIVEDGAHYRVLASGYANQDDLAAVRTQLTTEGLDSMPYAIETDALRMSLVAGAEEADAYKDVTDALSMLPVALIELAISFDRDQSEPTDCLARLKSYRDELETALGSFQSKLSTETAVSDALETCAQNVLIGMNDILFLSTPSRAELSASLKHLLLFTSDHVRVMYASIARQ